MYVIFGDGGKQYRAIEGQTVLLEKRSFEEGKAFTVEGLGFGADIVGSKACKIELTPMGTVRGPKVIIFKKKRRHNYRRKNGHRQEYVRVMVSKIS